MTTTIFFQTFLNLFVPNLKIKLVNYATAEKKEDKKSLL